MRGERVRMCVCHAHEHLCKCHGPCTHWLVYLHMQGAEGMWKCAGQVCTSISVTLQPGGGPETPQHGPGPACHVPTKPVWAPAPPAPNKNPCHPHHSAAHSRNSSEPSLRVLGQRPQPRDSSDPSTHSSLPWPLCGSSTSVASFLSPQSTWHQPWPKFPTIAWKVQPAHCTQSPGPKSSRGFGATHGILLPLLALLLSPCDLPRTQAPRLASYVGPSTPPPGPDSGP